MLSLCRYFLLCAMLCAGWQAALLQPAQAWFIFGGNSEVAQDSEADLANLPKADQIVVYKAKRKMLLLQEGQILRQYRVALGQNPVGDKQQRGDNRTPEGRYKIDLRNRESKYYLSLRISYPNRDDAEIARTLGQDPGDWIMIHGLPNGKTAGQMNHPRANWTNGCIAVTNQEMREIWQMVDLQTPITIWP